eukprot:1291763-Pyramimonas_sp.AAC.1
MSGRGDGGAHVAAWAVGGRSSPARPGSGRSRSPAHEEPTARGPADAGLPAAPMSPATVAKVGPKGKDAM